MRSFPTFAELEVKRNAINTRFHRETKPLLIERFQEFGFVPANTNTKEYMVLAEASTGNHYLLNITKYEIRVDFEHVSRHEIVKICEISNLGLSAHTIMNIIINAIDCWLQYGVVLDYVKAQHLGVEGR